MTLREHRRSNAFDAWIAAQAGAARVGEFYRVAGPRYISSRDVISGIGASRASGRWNPHGVMNVVYVSVAPETAMSEALEHFRYYNLPLSTSMPRVVIAVRVRIDNMLDLCDPAIARSLPVPVPQLLAEDWRAIMARGEEPTTQAFGRLAFQSGFEGMRVPSKPHPSGENVLVFPASLAKNSLLEVVNASELDKLSRGS